MDHFTYKIYKEQNICVITFNVTEFNMREMVLEVERLVLNNADWVPGMNVLYDMRSVKEITSFNYDEARSISNKEMVPFKIKYGNGKRALVASNILVYGELRMWVLTLITEERAMICQNLDEAFEWLEIDEPSAIGF